MTTMVTLARVPLARLRRSPRGWLPILGWTALGVIGALLTRSGGRVNGADHIMRGTFGYIVLPLMTYGIVSAVLGGSGLRVAVRGLVALGAPPPRAVLASVAVAMLASAFTCAFIGAILCVIAHGPGDPPLVRDLPASFGVAFVGAASYAAYFCVGSAIGRGAMRGVLLAADWILGAGAGFGALFTPRGHVMSLLGGPTVFEISRRTSSIFLVALTVLYVALAVRFGRKQR